MRRPAPTPAERGRPPPQYPDLRTVGFAGAWTPPTESITVGFPRQSKWGASYIEPDYGSPPFSSNLLVSNALSASCQCTYVYAGSGLLPPGGQVVPGTK